MSTFRSSGFRPPGSIQKSRGPRQRGPVQPPDKHRINHWIQAREVRVITDDGEQLGVLQLSDALRAAEDRGLDLVEVAGQASPPVCKIMDYGKFKYREQKKENEAKKNRSETTTKELRIRYSTDIGDLETKLKRATEFLEEGHKVKFSMRFKGREAMHVDLGRKKIEVITERLKEIAKIEEQSQLGASFMYVIYTPLTPGSK